MHSNVSIDVVEVNSSANHVNGLTVSISNHLTDKNLIVIKRAGQESISVRLDQLVLALNSANNMKSISNKLEDFFVIEND